MSFGFGEEGGLGHGDGETQLTPKLIEALRGTRALQVSAGGRHSLVLLEGGGVMSFGNGDHGRLGHGSDDQDQLMPKLVMALRGKPVLQVSAGNMHSLVLLEGGRVMSFGNGDHGRLGHGDDEDQYTPKLIEALRGKEVLQVSAGGYHSLLLLAGGSAMSFGCGWSGQLGHGDEEQQYTPKLIEAAARGVCVAEVAVGCQSSVLLGRSGEARHLGAIFGGLPATGAHSGP